MISLSIVIVNWNTKYLLKKCIDSIIININNITYEIIVVDNNSTDGSQEYIKKKFANIKLIELDKNYGFAKANNIGINSCVGEYICLVNSDIEIKSDVFKKMKEYLENHENVGIIGPKVLSPDGSIQRTFRNFPTYWNLFCHSFYLDRIFKKYKLFSSKYMYYHNIDYISNVEVLTGCFWMIRKKAIEEVGFLDENYFMYLEDQDYCKRFVKKNWSIVYFPSVAVIHYSGGSSKKNPLYYAKMQMESAIIFWEKYYGSIGKYYFIVLTALILFIKNFGFIFMTLINHNKYYYKLIYNIHITIWLLKQFVGKKVYL